MNIAIQEKKQSGRKLKFSSLTRITSLVRPHRNLFICGMIALSVGAFVNLLLPVVIRGLASPEYFTFASSNMGLVFGALAGLFCLQAGAFYLRTILFNRVGVRVVTEIRHNLFDAYLRAPISFFDQNATGDLVSRLNSDAALIQEAVSSKLSVTIRYSLQVLFGLAFMTWMSWQLSLAILCSLLVIVFASRWFSQRLRSASRELQGAIGKMSSLTTEALSATRVVRSLAAEPDLRKQFAQCNEESEQSVKKSSLRRAAVAALFSSSTSLLLNVLLLAVLWFGIYQVKNGTIELHDLLAFVLYGTIVAISFAFVVNSYSDLAQSSAAVERVFDLLPLRDNDQEKIDDRAIQTAAWQNNKQAALEWRGVSFAFPNRPETEVLSEVSISIKAGETIGIVGGSGAGKSTLMQLVNGFYPFECTDTRWLKIYGRNVSDYLRSEIPQIVSWVPQEGHLFELSIRENLLLGNVVLKADQIDTIVQSLPFLSFISELPEQLDTVVGERGATLSSGQRQRIMIARAIMRNPSILILDEATATLDAETEHRVLEQIRSRLPNATVVIISHRLASVKDADRVYVMEAGRVIQEGTHQTLREQDGTYQRYVAHQNVA